MPLPDRLAPDNAAGLARSALRDQGLDETPEATIALSASLAASVGFDDGRLVVLDANGNPALGLNPDGSVSELDPSAHVVALARSNATNPARPDRTTPPASGASTNRTAVAVARLAAERASARDPAVAAEAAKGPNPWSAATLNRTRQALIINSNPQLAARLKREASTR